MQNERCLKRLFWVRKDPQPINSIFLSYARGSDEPFVRRLYDDLRAHGFEVWFDRVSMPSRQLTFFQEIRDAIASCDRLLLVIGPKAIASDYVTQEWKNALEMGKCVNPIGRLNGERDDGGRIDCYALIPEELKLIHAEDFRDNSHYAESLANLVRQLSDPAPPLGKLVEVPALPVHYLAQRERLLELKDALLNDLKKPIVITGASVRVGVQGMGGIGKSVLAAALARDLDVRRAFPDGIFWIGVGQKPNRTELQRGLAKELGDQSLFNDLPAGKQKIKELLVDRAALLILDDVWQGTDANAFDVLGPRCKMLLTTRDAGLVISITGTGYQVQLPTEPEALALLASAAHATVESLPKLANEIVAECGRLPLALALCGGMIQAGVTWRDLLDALIEHELEFVSDRHALENQHRDLWRAMEVSIRDFPEDQQQRFAELAVFPSGVKFPEAAIVVLWGHTGGLSERHARRLLVEFKQRSLVQLDRSAETAEVTFAHVSMHDLLHDFAVRVATQLFGNLALPNNQLLDAYRKKCPNGWPSGPNDGYFFQHLRDHLVRAGRSAELVSLLMDLRWLEAKASNQMVFDLIDDYRALDRQNFGSDLADFERFVIANLHVLEATPWLTFQQAANQPSDRAPARTAHRLWSTSEERRPWIRWINKQNPQEIMTLLGHTAEITACMYSLDGSHILSGSMDGTLKIWDAKTGQVIETLDNEKPVLSCVYSRDGMRIASTTWDQIRIWDTTNGKLIRAFPAEGKVIACDYAPDGIRLVTATATTITVWDATTGQQIQFFARNNLPGDETTPTRGDFEDCVFSADSRLVVAIGHDSALRIWDLVTGEAMLIPPIERYVGAFDSSCTFSSDGAMIVSTGDPGLTIRGTTTKEVLKRTDGGGWGGPCGMSADNCWILSRLHRDEIGVWNAVSGQMVAVYSGHTAEVIDVAFSPDGKLILSGAKDSTLKVWKFAPGEEPPKESIEGAKTGGHTEKITSCAFSPDGARFATGSGDHTVRIWDSATGLRIGKPRQHPGGTLMNKISVAFSPLGRQLFSKSIRAPGLACVWDADTSQQLVVFSREDRMNVVNSFAHSPDGRCIALSFYDGSLSTWDCYTGDRTIDLIPDERWGRHSAYDEGCAFSPDGSLLVTLSGSVFSIWDITKGKLRTTVADEGGGWLPQVLFSPDAKRILKTAQTTTSILDLRTEVLTQIDNCRASAYSPDGRTIVMAHDSELRILDSETAQLIQVFKGHSSEIFFCQYTADGQMICSAARDGTLRIWDVETGKNIGTFFVGATSCVSIGPGCLVGAGDEAGHVYILQFIGRSFRPFVTTAVRLYRSDLKSFDEQLSAYCRACGTWGRTPDSIIRVLNHMPPNAPWDDPELVSKCPHCKAALRFTPFIVDNHR